MTINASRARVTCDAQLDITSDGPLTVNMVNCPTGTIEVRKQLDPSDDPGLFDLQIDGTTKESDASHGGTTGPVEVETGRQPLGRRARGHGYEHVRVHELDRLHARRKPGRDRLGDEPGRHRGRARTRRSSARSPTSAAAIRGRPARLLCARHWYLRTPRAPSRIASTGRPSRSLPAIHPRRSRMSSPSGRPTQTARSCNRSAPLGSASSRATFRWTCR